MKNETKIQLTEANLIGTQITQKLSKTDLKNVEVKSKKIAVTKAKDTKNKCSISSKNKEHFDEQHQSVNFIREEVILSNTPPKSSLSFLIFENNISELKNIIQKNTSNLDTTDSEGTTFSWTPLYWAVKLRRVECIKMLLAAGVNINVVVHDLDECCGTVMDLTSIREDSEIEKILRAHVDKEDLKTINSYTSIKTRPRGKAQPPSYIFYGNNSKFSGKFLGNGTDGNANHININNNTNNGSITS